MSHRLAAQSARDHTTATARVTLCEILLGELQLHQRNGHNLAYILAQFEQMLMAIILAENEFLNEDS